MVQLLGTITKDGVVSEVKGNKKVLNFSIAINDYYKTSAGEAVKTATYINCAYWRNPEKVDILIKKGKTIEVNGRISVNAYINQSGQAAATLNFHVSNFKIHGTSKRFQTTKEDIVNQHEPVKETAEDLPF